MEGFLEKKKSSGFTKGWVTRWFRLDNFILSYYSSAADAAKPDARPRRSIDLRTTVKVSDRGLPRRFALHTTERIYHFRAADGREKQRWLEHLFVFDGVSSHSNAPLPIAPVMKRALLSCLEHIAQRGGLHYRGIFRTVGMRSGIDKLVKMLLSGEHDEQQEDEQQEDEQQEDERREDDGEPRPGAPRKVRTRLPPDTPMYLVSSTFKRLLRELPETLFTNELFDAFFGLGSADTRNRSASASSAAAAAMMEEAHGHASRLQVRGMLLALPEDNFDILHEMFGVMNAVARNRADTLMDSDTLAFAVGECLNRRDQTSIVNMKPLFRLLINEVDTMFADPDDDEVETATFLYASTPRHSRSASSGHTRRRSSISYKAQALLHGHKSRDKTLDKLGISMSEYRQFLRAPKAYRALGLVAPQSPQPTPPSSQPSSPHFDFDVGSSSGPGLTIQVHSDDDEDRSALPHVRQLPRGRRAMELPTIDDPRDEQQEVEVRTLREQNAELRQMLAELHAPATDSEHDAVSSDPDGIDLHERIRELETQLALERDFRLQVEAENNVLRSEAVLAKLGPGAAAMPQQPSTPTGTPLRPNGHSYHRSASMPGLDTLAASPGATPAAVVQRPESSLFRSVTLFRARDDARMEVVLTDLRRKWANALAEQSGLIMSLTISLDLTLPRWVNDEDASECFSCKKEFGIFLRRHHCRLCGQIFCASCSSKRVTLREYNVIDGRVCDGCHSLCSRSNSVAESAMDVLRAEERQVIERVASSRMVSSPTTSSLLAEQARPGAGQDAWFIIDNQWLRHWKLFIAGKATRPGPITNQRLLQRSGEPREGLELSSDYRALDPPTWNALRGIYGGGPVIQRQGTNLYGDDGADDSGEAF